jgi:membrane protease YdiL (CAAX protease family)
VGSPISLGAVLWVMVAAIALAIPIGVLVTAADLGWMARIAVVELVCFAGPALLVARASTGSARGALGLGRPRAAALAGGAMIGASFWLVNLVLVAPWFAEWHTESDREIGTALAGGDPLLAKLLVLAVVPGVCEELLVRGAIARGLRPRIGLIGAVAVSSVYFAVLHLSPARAAPTLLLGALLAVMVLRSGSLWPAVVAHVLNNAVPMILLDRFPGAASFLLAPPLLLAMAAAAVSGAGLALVHRRGS